MGQESVEKRYEKHGRIKPCVLTRDDILALAAIIQKTFTKPEIDTIFSHLHGPQSHPGVLQLRRTSFGPEELGDRVADLSFWIEGWDQKTRFDKNILLDFSRYSIQLSVEGTDPVWVYDMYNSINDYLKNKTAWYWPVIIMEKVTVFFVTLILLINIVIALKKGNLLYYIDKLGLLALWMCLVFYDTRKIWPYSNIRLKEDKVYLSRENVVMFVLILMVIVAIWGGTILPFMR